MLPLNSYPQNAALIHRTSLFLFLLMMFSSQFNSISSWWTALQVWMFSISELLPKISLIFLTHKIYICRIKSYKYSKIQKKKKRTFKFGWISKLPSKNAILFFITLFNKVFAETYCVLTCCFRDCGYINEQQRLKTSNFLSAYILEPSTLTPKCSLPKQGFMHTRILSNSQIFALPSDLSHHGRP